jgi:hypothetical protein
MSQKIKELFTRTKEQGTYMTVYDEIAYGQPRLNTDYDISQVAQSL